MSNYSTVISGYTFQESSVTVVTLRDDKSEGARRNARRDVHRDLRDPANVSFDGEWWAVVGGIIQVTV